MAPANVISNRRHRFALICGGCWLLLSLWPASGSFAQRKPVLHPMRRDYFAGKFVLLPLDSRPVSFQLPRLIAHIADHDLIAPPRRLLGDQTHAAKVEQLIAWAKAVDYADADGVIVSLDLIADGGALSARAPNVDTETARKRLELMAWIHAQRPGIPIYGFTTAAERTPSISEQGSDQPINKMALDLVAAGALDYLLIHDDDDGQSAAKREQLLAEISARKLSDRVSVHQVGAAMILLARHLNRRFGFSPKVLAFYSSEPPIASAPHESGSSPMTVSRINALIKAMGGQSLPATTEAMRRADLLLFVHTPRTGGQRISSFAAEMARAIHAGYRVALLDVSDENESRERMMAELRRYKLCDQLSAYAASRLGGHAPGAVLAQASARLITAKFLRDDEERLHRAERAQVEVLFERALNDWAYDVVVRPKLETFAREELKADPNNLGAALDRAEEFARSETKHLAHELLSEQFRHNKHTILMTTGERLEFEVRALQRFQLRFPWERTSEAEILADVYLPPPAVLPPTGPPGKSAWELVTDPHNLDVRLLNRIDLVNWRFFEAGVGAVELSINAGRASPLAEDYAIRSRRLKNTRHIEITAPSVRGAFYALARLEQLGAEGKLSEDFQLAESPSFKQRGIVEVAASWSYRDRLDVLRFMGRVRMNRYYYAPPNDPLRRERWRENYHGNSLEQFKEFVRVAQENFVEVVYALSPGPFMTYASEEDLAALTRKLDSLAALGVRHFALFFDEINSSGSGRDRLTLNSTGSVSDRLTLEKAEDRARFQTLAAAHAHVINRVSEHLQRIAPHGSLAILPAGDADLQGSRDYLKELGAATPKEVQIFWTGAENSRREFTDAQAREWSALFGRPPIIWDNFPANDGEPWRLYLGAKRGVSPTLPSLSDEASGFIAQPRGQAHASMLPLATSADYAWNGRGYDPERALNRMLNLLGDERSRAGLRVWAETYRSEAREDHLFKPLFQQPRGEVNAALIEQRLAEMQAALESLGAARESGLLRGELAPFIRLTQAALDQYRER